MSFIFEFFSKILQDAQVDQAKLQKEFEAELDSFQKLQSKQ